MKVKDKKNRNRLHKTAMLSISLGALAACGSSSDNLDPIPSEETNIMNGTPNSDVLRGTSNNDKIIALGGDDRIFGFEGNDDIYTGTGSDVVFAGTGDDTVNIEEFGNSFDGGLGTDKLVIIGFLSGVKISVDLMRGEISGETIPNSTTITSFENIDASKSYGIEIISANTNNEILTGQGNDTIQLIGGTDNLISGGGSDVVTVTSGDHAINLGEGNDHLTITDGSHVANGGDGQDTLIFSANNLSGQLELDTNLEVISKNGQLLSRIENFESFEAHTNISVTFIGSTDGESFLGTDQADHFKGGGGNDVYTGGLGVDSFYLTLADTSIIQITDFKRGVEGDILVFESSLQVTSNNSNVEFINTNLFGKKMLNSSTDILIFTSEDGYSGTAELLQSVNGQNGISEQTAGALAGAQLISVWLDSSENNTKVSVLGDANRNGTFDSIYTYAALNNEINSTLSEFSTDNFLVL